MFLPNTMTRPNDQFNNVNDNDQLNLKLANENSDSVIIDAESDPNASMMESIPRQAVVVLPNGQRFFIGSIISAIPFLPFEVNVPDTIAWMYNGIAGILGESDNVCHLGQNLQRLRVQLQLKLQAQYKLKNQ